MQLALISEERDIWFGSVNIYTIFAVVTLTIPRFRWLGCVVTKVVVEVCTSHHVRGYPEHVVEGTFHPRKVKDSVSNFGWVVDSDAINDALWQ